MFNFFKKLFGLPSEQEKAAAAAPYKVEAPVPVSLDPAIPTPLKAEPKGANDRVESPAPEATKPAAMTAKKKPAAKKPAGEKAPAKPRAKKPKAKPAAE